MSWKLELGSKSEGGGWPSLGSVLTIEALIASFVVEHTCRPDPRHDVELSSALIGRREEALATLRTTSSS